ncbi:MAG: hypothetical protein HQL61_00875 [Magnetococcales bacterium]|nr:hypothetical protein [Nitrospirota bacterium]
MYRKTINVLTLAIVIFGFVQVSFSQDNVSSVACLDVTSESCVTELFSDYITTDQANAIRVIGWFKEIDEWINFRNELASYDDENERLLATYLFIFKRPYISVWIFGGSVFLKDKTVLQTYREIKEHYTSLFGLCMPPRLTFKIKLDWLDIFTTSPLNGAVIKMYQLSSCSSDYQYYTTLKAPTVITDFKFNRAYGAFESGTYLLTFEYKGKKSC